MIDLYFLDDFYEILSPIGMTRNDDLEFYLRDPEYYINDTFEWTESDSYFKLYFDIDEDFRMINIEIVNYDKERFTDKELVNLNEYLYEIIREWD